MTTLSQVDDCILEIDLTYIEKVYSIVLSLSYDNGSWKDKKSLIIPQIKVGFAVCTCKKYSKFHLDSTFEY